MYVGYTYTVIQLQQRLATALTQIFDKCETPTLACCVQARILELLTHQISKAFTCEVSCMYVYIYMYVCVC